MGSKSRRRFLATGAVFRDGKLVDVADIERVERNRGKMRAIGVATVEHYTTSNQVKFLADALHTRRLTPGKLKDALAKKAPEEMRKGYERILKSGRTPNVELLLEDYNKDTGFQELASEVGLDREYFIELAETEIARMFHNTQWQKLTQEKTLGRAIDTVLTEIDQEKRRG